MSNDLIPRNFFNFPSIPSFWNEDNDWLTAPATNYGLSVSEDEKQVYIEASLPGIDPKNIEVTFHDGYLWVRGETKQEENNSKKYYRQATRSFSYRVAVPGDIDEAKEPTATYKHGVMTVAFAKSPKSTPRKIPVKSITE
jgi:HSP20 family protein